MRYPRVPRSDLQTHKLIPIKRIIKCYGQQQKNKLLLFSLIRNFENKTLAQTFPKFPSVLHVIDRSDRNPPTTATTVTFRPSLRHASGK